MSICARSPLVLFCFLKLTCSTLQSTVILDLSIILIHFTSDNIVKLVLFETDFTLQTRYKHLEARHRGTVVTFKYIIKLQCNFDDYIYLCFLQSQSNYFCIKVSCTHSYTQLKQHYCTSFSLRFRQTAVLDQGIDGF